MKKFKIIVINSIKVLIREDIVKHKDFNIVKMRAFRITIKP